MHSVRLFLLTCALYIPFLMVRLSEWLEDLYDAHGNRLIRLVYFLIQPFVILARMIIDILVDPSVACRICYSRSYLRTFGIRVRPIYFDSYLSVSLPRWLGTLLKWVLLPVVLFEELFYILKVSHFRI